MTREGDRLRQRRSAVVLIAYVFHLSVPLFLVLDLLLTPRLAGLEAVAGRSDEIVVAVASLWLIAGLAAPFLWPDRGRFLRFAIKPLVSFYALFLTLTALEIVFRNSVKRRSPYPGVWMPWTRLVTRSDPVETPGIDGVSTFSVNEIGLRGPSPPPQGNLFRIVAIGGSSTECLALDDSEEWPHLVMEGLSARQKQRSVWVGNAGVSGHTTVEHRALLETLPLFSRSDLVIFTIGANDLWTSLAAEGAPTEKEQEHYAALFAASLLGSAAPRFPVYKRLRLFELVRDTVDAATRKFSVAGKESEVNYTASRRKRIAAPVVPLPDLRVGLSEYRERVVKLASLCQSHGARCLFLTQPSLWREDLPGDQQKLLWFGWVGPWKNSRGYVSVADATRALNAYNDALLEVCQARGLECFDLARRIPHDASAFYDDFHLNEQGARLVARTLVDYLLQTSPFSTRHELVSERRPAE